MMPALASTIERDVVRVENRPLPASWLVLKRCIQTVFSLWVLPRLILYHMARRLLGRRAFGVASESIARAPGLWGVYVRQAFYRRTLASCGQDVFFGWQSAFSMPEARIGERAYIG